MISFIKSHSDIFILIFLLLMTLDSFIIAIKFRNYLETLPKIKISYDIIKSYYLSLYQYKTNSLVIVNLTLENKSNNPVNITGIKLIGETKPYSATIPEIRDDFNENGITLINLEEESESIKVNILSENILLKNMELPSQYALSGYAVFENVETITPPKSYEIVIETSKKVFKKEIIINSVCHIPEPVNQLKD